MQTDTQNSPTVEFMLRLRKIDRSYLNVRDVLFLYAIIARPGISGSDAGIMIGVPSRSCLQFSLSRLIKYGLVEDRRDRESRGIPNQLYPLPAGIEFWEDLKP